MKPNRALAWRGHAALMVSALVHVAAAAVWWFWPAAWAWCLGAVIANHALLFAAALMPRSRLLGPNLARLPRVAAERGEVGLSFDDGPDPDITPRVLDLLDAHGARASFFCIGERAAAHPALVREIVARGHRVENHSARHPIGFGFYGPLRMAREIARAQALLAAAAGIAPRYFRAPMGIRNPMLAPVLVRLGLHYASWTRRGYDAVAGDPARILARLTRGLRAGDIVLLHDGPSPYAALRPHGAPAVLEVLPRLLEHLAAQGWRGVPLPEPHP